MEKGMIGSQAGMWAMTGKDRKTRIIAGEEEKKRETTDSTGSRVHSSLRISTHGPPQGPSEKIPPSCSLP